MRPQTSILTDSVLCTYLSTVHSCNTHFYAHCDIMSTAWGVYFLNCLKSDFSDDDCIAMNLKKWWQRFCPVWTWMHGDTFGTERWKDESTTSSTGLTADRYATQPVLLIVCVCVGLQWPFKWISRVPVSGREGVTPRPINVSTSLTPSTPALCCPPTPSYNPFLHHHHHPSFFLDASLIMLMSFEHANGYCSFIPHYRLNTHLKMF